MTITLGPAVPGGAGAGGWGLPEAEVAEDAAVMAAGAPAADAAGPITEAPASPFAGLPPLDARLVLQLQLAACSLATPDASAAGIARFHAALSALLGTLPAPGSPQVRGPEPSPSAVAPPVSQTITVRADPAELAVADLLRLDPELQALLAPFARDAAMPDTALGRQLIALYGPERAAALHRLAGASAEVRRLFLSALDDALRRTPLGPAGFTTSAAGQYAADGHLAPAGLPPWWRLTHHGSAFDSPHTLATFDPAAFVAAYAAQDTPEARAFADLHGPEVVRLSHTQTGPEGDRWEIAHRLIGSGRFELRLGFNDAIEHQASRWVPSTLGTPWTGGLAVLDPARPVELFQPDLIRFDPAMGFVTPSANLVPEDDWVDQALVLGAGAFAGWFGAQVIAPALGGGSLGAAAAGAAASAAGSLVATGSIHLKDVLRGALGSLVTAGLSQAAGLDTLGYQLDDAGKVVLEGGRPVIASYTLRSMAVLGTASVKGLVTELAGGRFQDGFRQGLALDLAQGLAGELVREFDAHIAAGLQAGTLGPGEASVLQTLGRAVGTAVRVAATPGDPAAALAAEMLQTLGEAIGEDIVLAGVAGLQPTLSAFDDEGVLMPGVVDAGATWDVQQEQLAAFLIDQGEAPEQAWARAQLHFQEERAFQAWFIEAEAPPVWVADASGGLPSVRDAREVIDRIESRIASGGVLGAEVGQAIGEVYATYLDLNAAAMTQAEVPTVAQERAATRLIGLISDLGHLARQQSLELTADQQSLVRLARGHEMQRFVPELYGAAAGGGILALRRTRRQSTHETAHGSMSMTQLQLDRKFKHASAFGVDASQKNGVTLADFEQRIVGHMNADGTQMRGTYLYSPGSRVYYNPQSRNVVILDANGEFVSGWKLEAGSLQYENFIRNGTLR